MNIKNLSHAFIAACFAVFGMASLSVAAPAPMVAQAPVARGIADDYLVAASFDPRALFAKDGARSISVTLPQIGKLQIVHVETKVVDTAGKVLRWQGHVQGRQDLQAHFVRGISGNITGVLDTPRGRILLGNANGEYFFHGEAPDSAPGLDNGKRPALLVTQDAPSDKPTTHQAQLKPDAKLISYPVEFNIAGLANLTPGQEAQLSLPGTGDFVVRHDDTQPGDLGGATFVGHLKDFGDDFRVLVTYSPGGAQGSILTPYGEFQLQTLGSKQWLVDITRSKLEKHHAEESDTVVPSIAGGAVAFSAGNVASATSSTSAGTTTGTTANSILSNGKTRIDVLVLYTPGLESRFGGKDPALNRLQLLAALSNQAYTDSNVQISLRVVGAVKVEMPDTTSNTQMLSAMQQATGYFANIRALRQTYGADLVTLVRPFYATAQGGNCGVGYVGGYGGNNIAGYSAYGYSVVSDGSDLGGQNYYCDNYTFAHELGHNMGSMHDRATVQAQGGGTGAYPYSFGHGVSGTFGTIMSYIRPTVGKFSTPAVTCSNSNLPCGVAATDSAKSADNALSLNNTRSGVAGFMAEVNTLPYTIAGVVTLNSAALANVAITPSAAGASCSNSGSNGVYSCSVSAGWSGSLTPTLGGYTFTPTPRSFSNVQASAANQNFAATLLTTPVAPPPTSFTIRGIVTAKGLAIPSVLITPSTKGVSCSSNNSGAYSCTVPRNWIGSLTASKSGYSFVPALRTFSKVLASQTSMNFEATLKTVKITGYVRAKGKAVGGVQINASTQGATCTKTGSDGGFTCTVPENWSGTLAPLASGSRFKPAAYGLSRVTSPLRNLNYEATK